MTTEKDKYSGKEKIYYKWEPETSGEFDNNEGIVLENLMKNLPEAHAYFKRKKSGFYSGR